MRISVGSKENKCVKKSRPEMSKEIDRLLTTITKCVPCNGEAGSGEAL
jgi:hypothetical protein